jgi:peptidoglycan/LPS O-acetylase OafA/YrhL
VYFEWHLSSYKKGHKMTTASTLFHDSKQHFEILDGLRGVAAIMVVLFHVFEIFSGGNHLIQIINHGYLAVDFFFVLSGFVIAYAYDDRWGRMSLGSFFKRRLIRLHPMIVMGMIIGAICFYFGASPDLFPPISQTPVGQFLLILLIGLTLIPVPPSMDIRGWGEMHPLNGPAWTLFFEYLANIAYALFLKKVSNKVLSILVVLAAVALIHLGITSPQGDVIGGWSLNAEQLRIGFTRLAYPFLAGMLLCRIVTPTKIKNAFLWCSLLIIVVLAFPRIGGSEDLWLNGLYDALTIIILFPLIIYMGISDEVRGKFLGNVCRFLGDISYPLYITHYPIMYVYYAWVVNNKLSMVEALPMGFLAFFVSIAVAYASLKLYDVPLRKWLARRFMKD